MYRSQTYFPSPHSTLITAITISSGSLSKSTVAFVFPVFPMCTVFAHFILVMSESVEDEVVLQTQDTRIMPRPSVESLLRRLCPAIFVPLVSSLVACWAAEITSPRVEARPLHNSLLQLLCGAEALLRSSIDSPLVIGLASSVILDFSWRKLPARILTRSWLPATLQDRRHI